MTQENKADIESFAHDICMISKLSKMFMVEDQPNFVAFYVKSIARLEKVLTKEHFSVILDMWRILMRQTTKQFSAKFKNSVMGEVLFLEETDTEYLIANEKTGHIESKINLA